MTEFPELLPEGHDGSNDPDLGVNWIIAAVPFEANQIYSSIIVRADDGFASNGLLDEGMFCVDNGLDVPKGLVGGLYLVSNIDIGPEDEYEGCQITGQWNLLVEALPPDELPQVTPAGINAWIDGEIAKATGDSVYIDPAKVGEIARGAALYIIADRVSLIKNLERLGYTVTPPTEQ